MDPIEKSITNLKQLATKINRASDAAQNALAHYESLLQETGIGVEVWVSVVDQSLTFDDDHHPEARGIRIGWAKIGGDWRIAFQPVEVRFEDKIDKDYVLAHKDILADLTVWNEIRFEVGDSRTDVVSAQPVANASRNVRFEALALVPRIIAELTEEAKKVATHADAVSKVIAIDEWAKRKEKPDSDSDIPF